jgi:hypothetical protein
MTTVNLSSDDVGATLKRINRARGQRYGEIIGSTQQSWDGGF